MRDCPEIRSDDFPYDMGPWCSEKAQDVVVNLAQMIDEIMGRDDIPEDVRVSLRSHLGYAMWNGTKLLAFSKGADWQPEDCWGIMEHGYAGYEEVAVKYKIIDKTTRAVEQDNLSLFVTRFRELLGEGRSPGRTRIHELLRAGQPSHPIVVSLKDLTEKVTNGEITWEEYVCTANSRIEILSNELPKHHLARDEEWS